METVWTFAIGRFEVALEIQPDIDFEWDGDAADDTQAKLESGEYVAFESAVRVHLNGVEIGADHLGGSVYESGAVADFWRAHRDPDPMNRNCSIMRAAWRGEGNPDAKVSICHYFPDMVRAAIAEARKWMAATGTPMLVRETED